MPSDNQSLIKPVSGITKTQSNFHKLWIQIKGDYEKGGDKEEGVESAIDAFYIKKSIKGKESFSEKVSESNSTQVQEHKQAPVSFFENLKKKFVKQEEIAFTYNELAQLDSSLKSFTELTYDSTQYTKLSESDRELINKYEEAAKRNYLSNGLSDKEAEERLERDGPNKLPEKKKVHWSVMFLHEISSVFSLLLWGGGILALFAYFIDTEDSSNLFLAFVLWACVLISAAFTLSQNLKSESILDSFKVFSNSKAIVIRGGQQKEILALDLVVGDVCLINEGDKIPADIRIFEANDLTSNNSTLTGESKIIKLKTKCNPNGYKNYLESENIAFFFTMCASGKGKGVIIKTGKDTYMGKIAELANSASESQDGHSLENETNKYIKIISIIAITVGLGFFLGGVGVGYPMITNITMAIGVIVANVPEGLLSCLTVALALNAKILNTKGMMSKQMKSVETLGAITCICADKTGTLTQNRMSVKTLWYDMEFKSVSNQHIDLENIETIEMDPKDPSFKYLQFCAICGSGSSFIKTTPEDFPAIVKERNAWQKLNPKAKSTEVQEEVLKLQKQYQPEYDEIYKNNIDKRLTNGDADEEGLLKFFEKIENIDIIRERFPLVVQDGEEIRIPFTSETKSAGYLRNVNIAKSDAAFEDTSNSKYWLAYKGAPEYLIKKCKYYLQDGRQCNMDNLFPARYREAYETMQAQGLRVLAFAFAKLDPKKYNDSYVFKNDTHDYPVPIGERTPNFPIDDLCMAGLIISEDPPRPGLREALEKLKRSGVKIIMITGDSALTAASISYQIGLIESLDETPEVIKHRFNLSSIEEAEKMSKTIIVDGLRLSEMLKKEEILSEDNPNKGAFLREVLMKDNVVFCRVNPDQKLQIVSALQKLKHIVAVTGDGVNDAPAMKKADIGIAMGITGTEVTKDTADILILDDNFSNIVRGIKRGRVVFDILKRMIGYNLTSNIGEVAPVILSFIMRFPLPMNAIQILVIDLLSDVYINITYAYERAESDIMEREPRNVETDSLCSFRLFGYSYLFFGWFMPTCGFLGFFGTLKDYGILPKGAIGIIHEKGIEPYFTDTYDPLDMYKGNSRAFLIENSEYLGIEGDEKLFMHEEEFRRMDYLKDEDSIFDMRLFLYQLDDKETWGECYYPGETYDGDYQVCWSLDAIRHAQTSYFVNVVLLQVVNGICYRTISVSIFKHIFDNWDCNQGYFVVQGVMLLLVYCPGLNKAFGCRALYVQHWCQGLAFWVLMFFYSELTKYLIRNVKQPDGSPGFFSKWFKY